MAFIQKKSGWIVQQYQRQCQKSQRIQSIQQLPEGKVWLLGEIFEYEFHKDARNYFRFQGKKLHIFTKQENPDIRVVYDVIRAFSEKYLVQRAYEIARRIELVPRQVKVKTQRSKWGSCSSLQNINLNWRLIFLAPLHIDYVIIHELCHLKHMNHSPLFWDLVAIYCPHYKESEKHLKEHQWILDIYKD